MRLRAAWGLDIGSSALKLVKVEDNGGRLSVQTYGPVALPTDSPSPDALARGLDTLFSSAGAKRQPYAAALPRSVATIKFPRLPRTSPQQLAQMVRFEAQRYVPFAVEDVVLGFQDLPGHARTDVTAQGTIEQMELLLVAVRRDTVTAYREALGSAAGPPTHLSVSTLGLWSALRHSPVPADPDEAVVVLDIGGKSSTVVAFHGGEMIFNRSAGVGGDGLTTALMSAGLDRPDAEARKRDVGVETLLQAAQDGPAVQVAAPEEGWAGALASEIRRSLAALRGEHRGVRVERLFLTGGGAKAPGLAEYLESSTGLPVRTLELPGLVTDPQFIEAAGVAIGGLGHDFTGIDLIAEEIERERLLRRHRTRMRLATLAGLAVLVAAGMLGIASMQAQRERAQKIQSVQLYVDRADRKLKAAQKAHESVQLQADLLRSALDNPHPWLDVLQDLSDRAPRNVWLTGVDLEKGKPLGLRGTAMNGQAVQAFWGNLSHSPLFVKPTLSYSNAAKIDEKPVFQFGITSDIVGNKPKPAKPAKKRTRAKSTTGTAPATSGGSQGEAGAGG